MADAPTPARFTKKPVTIDAILWTGENVKEVMDFLQWRNADHDEHTGLVIRTLEGAMYAAVGDYIIKGLKGEFYPCKPDIFQASYSPETVAPSPPVAAPPATPVALGRYVIFTRPGKVPERKGPYPTTALMESALREIQQAYPDAISMVLVDLPTDCWPTSGVEWIDMHGDKRKGRLIATQPQPAQPLTDKDLDAEIERLSALKKERATAFFETRIGLPCSQCGDGKYQADGNGYSQFHRCDKCHHVPMWNGDSEWLAPGTTAPSTPTPEVAP